MNNRTSAGEAPKVFPHTRWSVVLAATRKGSPESAAAHFVQIVCGIRRAAGVLWLNSAIKTVKSPMTMKTQPHFGRFVLAVVVTSLLAGVATDAFAQGAGKEAPAAGQNAAPSPAYDLEIKDGLLLWTGAKRKDNASQVPANLQNVVDLLRELHPDANFAASPELAGTGIADLKMRTSSVEEKLEAIRIASGSEFLWRNARPTSIDPNTGLPVAHGNKPSPALYVLEMLPATGKPGLQVETFHLGEHFAYVYGSEALRTNKDTAKKLIAEQMDQVERMVDQTVREYRAISEASNKSKTGSLPMPSIRFHGGANLAVIIGEPEAVAVAAKVIGALPGAKRSVAADGSVARGSDSPESAQKLADVIQQLYRAGAFPAQRR